MLVYFFFFQAEDGIRDYKVTGVDVCSSDLVQGAGAAPASGAAGRGNRRPPHSRRAAEDWSDDTRRDSCPRAGSPCRGSSTSEGGSDPCETWSTSSRGGASRAPDSEGWLRNSGHRPRPRTGFAAREGTWRG